METVKQKYAWPTLARFLKDQLGVKDDWDIEWDLDQW